MNTLNLEIGRRIATMRRKRGLTQEKLADLLQCSVKHISYVERGTTSFSLKKLIELTEIFDCSMDYLTMGTTPSATSELPSCITDTLTGGTEQEQDLLLEYLQMYGKLRQTEDMNK